MSRSAAAAAGLFLSSCFGERVADDADAAPDVRRAGPDARHALADQARRCTSCSRTGASTTCSDGSPAREARPPGVRSGAEVPLIHCPEWLPGDLPHDTPAWTTSYNGGADGRVRARRVRAVLRVLAVRAAGRPELLRVGRAVRALRQRVRLGRRGPRTRTTCSSSPARRAARSNNPENILTKHLNDGRVFKSWGCDAYGEDVFVYARDEDGDDRTALDVLHVRHRRRAALEARHRLGLLLGRPVPGRLHLAGLLRDRAGLRERGALGRAHLAGRRPAARHRGGRLAARSRG